MLVVIVDWLERFARRCKQTLVRDQIVPPRPR
jgi:hypothetical protein